jgi:hypothetical protein
MGDGPETQRFDSTTVSVVRRNPLYLALGASPWMIGIVLVLAALVTAKAAFLTPLFHLAIFGTLGFFFAYKRNKNPVFESGDLACDREAVRFRGQPLIRRDEIANGFVVPKDGRTFVRLVRKGIAPSVELDVKDVDEGRAILRALGLDATQTVARTKALSGVFSWPAYQQMLLFLSPTLGMFLGGGLGALLLGPKGVLAGTAFLFVSLAAILTTTLSRTQVDVGADGILTRWFGKERYFPFSQIRWVNPWEGKQLNKTYLGVELVMRSGEVARVLVGQKRWAEEEAGLLIERIREAIDAYTEGMAGDDASVLGRKGRDPKDWLTRLRAIGAEANADMRTPPIPKERLWRIVEDASAKAVSRACAAVALAGQLPPSERQRIRVVAETTASPKLRVALEQATLRETSDDALAASLAELEAEAADEPEAHRAG